ncbi:MAG: glycoside hydrolase family 5 protein [Anaerolineaceae bacterium]|nr:glycoside hydrolase family 5 protein [Anaerolineaceae bacterium]
MKISKLVMAGLAIFVLVGCSVGSPTATSAPEQVDAATATALPLKVPTARVFPTFTPKPTAIPRALSEADMYTFEQARKIGRGVNLGNALEAPNEGEWGVVLEERFFDLIRDAGFNSVRVPIRWSNHALSEAPYTIDEAFFERVDWVVENALERDLVVIINMHHYEEIFKEPEKHKERYLALWAQIAERYQGQPEDLYFEPLNEPNGQLNFYWNTYLTEVLALIRDSNPQRMVVLGPTDWNSLFTLASLRLPEDDRNIIVTFHYYLPFEFTHQGAEWAEGSDAWLGTKWPESNKAGDMIRANFRAADEWSKLNGRPIFLGEFGAYRKADMESRALWTAHVVRTAEEFGFGWAYWEFCSGFGVYDLTRDDWNEALLTALLP